MVHIIWPTCHWENVFCKVEERVKLFSQHVGNMKKMREAFHMGCTKVILDIRVLTTYKISIDGYDHMSNLGSNIYKVSYPSYQDRLLSS